MIGFLSGKILEAQDGKVLIGLTMGAAFGTVGYTISVPGSARYGALTAGQSAEFYIHTHVREDALDLIGFLSKPEKELFLSLLTVNGIGPKGALSILTKVEPSTLIEAVLSDNKSMLTEIPGIGKKTAERIVVELADSLRKKVDLGAVMAADSTSSSPSTFVASTKSFREAKDALSGLGYREQEIVAALKKLQQSDSEEFKKTEEIIKLALKELS
jgi:Holliday junction DNA helicase RuvA